MRVEILGCSGGIGGNGMRTTSLLIDDDILIDAGTGVGDLSLAQLTAIDHVFITHAHLDHIACLPLMIDSVGDLRSAPLTMYATAPTLEIIRKHIFNWHIWPDFSVIPNAEQPFLRFATIEVGQAVPIGQRSITPLPAEHTVPAVGYQISNHTTGAALAFSGDTCICPPLWEAVNRIPQLRYLIIEAAFANRDRELALLSKHLCPSLLLEQLQYLQGRPEVLVTHAKPGQLQEITAEIGSGHGPHHPHMLATGTVLEF
ncbi:3',5'-cyclic-nucleotide phosphodiesterase [Herbaspirillum rubrisubalbicans]|uniref:3',5'-cyclic-nucleotide phosphodiesterase n=1 Tax=Herbaspirillum rubrisubalbicans TaxID=80842 RepID=A0AAD0U7J2_9BURK|nr:3',5'-cyclic-nucleotide phosphodiesterase [Herbaspirillum rubrisubalbicans]ALU87513.1 cAMP phosphodiesterases protein [Herbaspirillum rubrisubalbicans M1]AYR22555.1 3',5'-cyclic-nucleotide phosphodiesterase [Herbaspirillum rubrisubalbicans]